MIDSDIPPLGQPPAFITEELTRRAETREQIDAIEHRSIDDYEDMGEVFTELSNFAVEYKQRFGVEGEPLDPDSIRVYDASGLARLVEVFPDAETGGIFDPETGVSHVLRMEPHTLANTLSFIYGMAHEVGHHETNALNGGSNRLGFVVREGQADRFAKEFLLSRLPTLYPGVLESTQKYVSKIPKLPVIDGVQIEPQDVIFAIDGDEGLEASGFSRIFEMRAMDAIEQNLGTEAYNEFMYRALSNDASAIPYLSDLLGNEFWIKITSPNNDLSARDVLQALQPQANPESMRADPSPITDNSERVAAGLVTPLPEGFRYGRLQDYDAADIESLFETAYPREVIWNMYLSTREQDLSMAGLEENDILVCHRDQLVGFANIISRGLRGEMGDLVVHPDFQHQGLAQALILERLAEAEQRGIESLFIPPLSDKNSLETFYIEQGFVKNNDGSFSRGPDPKPVLYVPEM